MYLKEKQKALLHSITGEQSWETANAHRNWKWFKLRAKLKIYGEIQQKRDFFSLLKYVVDADMNKLAKNGGCGVDGRWCSHI